MFKNYSQDSIIWTGLELNCEVWEQTSLSNETLLLDAYYDARYNTVYIASM